MNIKQLETYKNCVFKLNLHSRNHLGLSVLFLLITLGVGYYFWRDNQLDETKQSIQDCFEDKYCEEDISTLEKLVKAKKSLKLFDLESANLSNAHLENADLESANLENANLTSAHLEKANLKNANLSISEIVNAHLEKARLENANLSHVRLDNSYLREADLHNAYLSDTHAYQTFFNLANLRGAHIYNGDFEQSYFHRADLADTYFYGSNFRHANFYGANLKGAHLIESKNLTPAQIKSACNWEQGVYAGKWELDLFRWEVDKKANQKFIEQLRQEKKSDPKKPVDCSNWR